MLKMINNIEQGFVTHLDKVVNGPDTQARDLGHRRVHVLDCIMGNRRNMAGNSKVCMAIQSKIDCT